MSHLNIDWTNKSAKVSKYFTVGEVIYLPQWSRLANESDGFTDEAKEAVYDLFNDIMDPIREIVGKPITVHCAYRPPEYNKLVGGAKESCHMARNDAKYGLVAACDWSADMGKGSIGANCDELKNVLVPLLDQLGIRMENNGTGAKWIHVDNRAPGPSGRYFPI